MTIAATITALQTLHAGISGIKSAPTAFPSNVNTASLPLVLTMPGPANWLEQAVGLKRQNREYIVRVYVNPVAQDKAGPENAMTTINALIQLFGRAYLADLSLSGAIDHIDRIEDSGAVENMELTTAGITYYGFVFRLGIVEKSA